METCWREFVVEKYALRHLLIISNLCKQMQIFCKKVFRIFGVYAVKQ